MTADAIVTDPPYGLDFAYASYDDSRAAWFDLMDAVVPMMRAAARCVVMPMCGIDRAGWWYANHAPDWLMAWYKGSPGHRAFVGFNDWEPHLIWGKPPTQIHDYFQTRAGFEMATSFDDNGHPCPKPEAWAKWLVSRISAEGATVLDPFMGSGTTLVAAKSLGRHAIGIEIEERYCEIAAQRCSQEVLGLLGGHP
jgi:site-specific DNA-methyltransferase (adenine-specific)